ncbi:MAG: gluconokinase [Candidatus Sumerlaeaceae bacterium]
MIIVVMGVTGSGKTTLGKAIADKLHLPFYDADDFHPEQNRAKLKANIALDDADRLPWLEILAENLAHWERSGGAVLACSALKEAYRDLLGSGTAGLLLVYIKGDKQQVAQRLTHRAVKGHELIQHFSEILDGQFRDLEEPQDAIVVSIQWSVNEAASCVVDRLTRLNGPGNVTRTQ